MSTFNEREKAFEAKFTHDAQKTFETRARRNKLLGQWAADRLGKTGEDASIYIQEIIKTDLQGADDAHLLNKLRLDLGERVSESDLRQILTLFMTQAKPETV